MPSFSFSTQTAILQALFQGIPLPAVPQLYVALHNANPGESGTQSTNETSYSNYVRVAVPCSPGSWAVSQNDPAQIQNIQAITFPVCGSQGDTLTFWSLGYAASGPGVLLTSGPIGANTAYAFSANYSGVLFLPLLPPGTVVNAPVVLYQFGPGMLLPNGFNEGQVYYVNSVNPNVLTISATPGGPVLLPSTMGTGLLMPVTPVVASQNIAPTFPPNSLLTFMD